MSTITLEDLRKHAPNKPPKEPLYSREKSEESWELYCETAQERAAWTERVVADLIQRHTGYETKQIPGSKACDVIVNLGHEIVRVEVKSSISAGDHNLSNLHSYRMQAVQCEKFDYLFIACITPNGVILKWATVEDVKRDLADRREKNIRHRNRREKNNIPDKRRNENSNVNNEGGETRGETLVLHVNKIPEYFNDLEDFTL